MDDTDVVMGEATNDEDDADATWRLDANDGTKPTGVVLAWHKHDDAAAVRKRIFMVDVYIVLCCVVYFTKNDDGVVRRRFATASYESSKAATGGIAFVSSSWY